MGSLFDLCVNAMNGGHFGSHVWRRVTVPLDLAQSFWCDLCNLSLPRVYSTIWPKNKRFVCPFGLKIRRVDRSIFFFKNLDAEEIQYHACMCAFLGVQCLRIDLIMVLEAACIPLHLSPCEKSKRR